MDFPISQEGRGPHVSDLRKTNSRDGIRRFFEAPVSALPAPSASLIALFQASNTKTNLRETEWKAYRCLKKKERCSYDVGLFRLLWPKKATGTATAH